MDAADGYLAKYGPIDIWPAELAHERKWHRQVLDLQWVEAKLRVIVKTAANAPVVPDTVQLVGEAKEALLLVAGVRITLEEAMAKKRKKGGRGPAGAGKKGC